MQDKRSAHLPSINSPLTRFLVKLMKMTPEQRAKADPQKAADGYDLPIEWTTYYINHWRRVW